MARIYYGEDTMKMIKKETTSTKLKKLTKEELLKTRDHLKTIITEIDKLIETYSYESGEYQTIGDCRYLATVAIGTCTDLLRA